VTGSILLVTLVEKFAEGGWMTVVITGVVIAFCLPEPTRITRSSEERSARQTRRWAGSHIPKFVIRRRSIPTAIPPCFVVGLQPQRRRFMLWSGCGENFRANFETASS